MEEWQPRETAPRDGRRFLAFNAMVGIYSTECVTINGNDEFPLLLWCGQTGRWFPTFSHWQPLPPPPKDTP